VFVSEGTFTMNGGKISDNTSSVSSSYDSGSYYSGGGVNSRGTFVMEGGTISGNTATYGGGVNVAGGTFGMEGGTISGNTASNSGGGVYVPSNGAFTKTGGTVYGYVSGNSNSNTVKDGTVQVGKGHAVYVNYATIPTHKETTAGLDVNLSWNGTVNPPTFSGDWDH
jgi:hypothetical protein